MNNEGLDALAALASASPSTPTREESERSVASESTSAMRASNSDGGSNPTGNTQAEVTYPRLTASNIMQALQAGKSQQQQQQPSVNNNGGNDGFNPNGGLNNSNLALLMSLQQQQQQQQRPQEVNQTSALSTLQQLSYYQQFMNGGAQMTSFGGDRTAAPNNTSTANYAHPNHGMAPSFALQSQQRSQTSGDAFHPTATQVLPKSSTSSNTQPSTSDATSIAMPLGSCSMPPPPAADLNPISVSTLGVPSPHSQLTSTTTKPQSIAPQPSMDGACNIEGSAFEVHIQSKKTQKRAVNRLSAQLSRKRKKAYIEELKEENDDLRRKELILKSIPDLIVVFDSAGKIRFVSESVSMFLGMNAAEMEGTSFWDRLCQDSVRLLKAAFMDSLAAREQDADSVPLGSGVWELRLVNKDSSHTMVALNGVVHFAGDHPECVCSIRPLDQPVSSADRGPMQAATDVKECTTVTMRPHVKPQQSVVSNCSSSSSSGPRKAKQQKLAQAEAPIGGGKDREAIRISDSGNSSIGDSESGSGDEMIGV